MCQDYHKILGIIIFLLHFVSFYVYFIGQTIEAIMLIWCKGRVVMTFCKIANFMGFLSLNEGAVLYDYDGISKENGVLLRLFVLT